MTQHLRRWWRYVWRRTAPRLQECLIPLSPETTVPLHIAHYGGDRHGLTDEAMVQILMQAYATRRLVLWGIKGTPPLSLN